MYARPQGEWTCVLMSDTALHSSELAVMEDWLHTAGKRGKS